MARTTLNNDLRRPLYATVGATDRAVELVRGSVGDLQARLVDLQQSINQLEREPQGLRARALQVPTRVRDFLEEHDVAYGQLVARGDALVRRVRRQKSTQEAVKSARTTSSKAKTTSTQAGNAGRRTAGSAQRVTKNAATTARSQSKAPQRSAKATATTAGRTARSTAKATADAAKKVGD